MALREARQGDIPCMHGVRMAVRENTLSNPDRITGHDYLAALDELGRTWVVESNGRIVAFATGYRSGSIWALFVHPDHEALGYGSALHSTVVDWLWSLGHACLWLTTSPGTRAERFYIAKGWRPSGLEAGGDLRLVLRRP